LNASHTAPNVSRQLAIAIHAGLAFMPVGR